MTGPAADRVSYEREEVRARRHRRALGLRLGWRRRAGARARRDCDDPLALVHADGSCTRPGVPVDGCAEGFEHDGEYGCVPVLPAEPCPEGTMATPGDTACHPPMPCGSGKWGDIPRDATTQHVDLGYVGPSDGSERQPWTTIGEAVEAASPGAVVAITDGTYAESVVVATKPVQLRGVCPDRVTIVGTAGTAFGCAPSGVCVLGAGASATVVGGVSVTGGQAGIIVDGATGVVIEGVRVHDNPVRGINLQDELGPASAELRAALVEGNTEFGIYAGGASVVVEDVLVRDGVPRASDMLAGHGIVLSLSCGASCDPTKRSEGLVRRTVIERNRGSGITTIASDLVVEDSVVRGQTPLVASGDGGYALAAWTHCDDGVEGCDVASRSNVTVARSVLAYNQDAAVFSSGAAVSLDATVVADTQPRLDQAGGRGVSIQTPCLAGAPGMLVCNDTIRPQLDLLRSLVDRSHDIGVFVSGGDAAVEATVVRATQARVSDQLAGRGLNLQASCTPGPVGALCNEDAPAIGTVTTSLIADSRSLAVFAGGAAVDVTRSAIRRTSPRLADGVFGDGVTYLTLGAQASGRLEDVTVEDSARAGVASFGASVQLRAATIRCAPFPLTTEDLGGQTSVIEDLGDNRCGCPDATESCKSISAGLEPPTPP